MSRRVYISGAITGVKDYSIRFCEAENYLKEKGYGVVNPIYMDSVMSSADYEDYMRVDLFLLGMCDAIYMLEGWENSRGANREYGYALAKGMDIMFERE